MAELTTVLNIEKPGNHSRGYPRIDDGFEYFDTSIAGRLALALTGVSTTLTELQGRNAVLVFSGTPGGAATVTVPAFTGKQYFVLNNTNQAVTVKMATGTGVAITAGSVAALLNDGTNVVETYATAASLAAAVVGLLDDKGNYNCSANPNYPSALKGDVYTVSVAGKIGGASGVTVDVGDVFRAIADNAGGTQAAVGASWAIVQANLVGALITSDIGVLVQAYSSVLTTYAGINPSANVQTLLGAATFAAFKTSLSLNLVENTALSTWAGSANITTLGTVATGAIPTTLLTGTLQAAQMPALTGDVTNTAGSLATTIGAGKVTNAMLAGSIAASKLIGTDISRKAKTS